MPWFFIVNKRYKVSSDRESYDDAWDECQEMLDKDPQFYEDKTEVKDAFYSEPESLDERDDDA